MGPFGGQERSKPFFFEKKNQKTFVGLGVHFVTQRPAAFRQSLFASFSSEKEDFTPEMCATLPGSSLQPARTPMPAAVERCRPCGVPRKQKNQEPTMSDRSPEGPKARFTRDEATEGYIPKPPSPEALDTVSEAQAQITDDWTGEPPASERPSEQD